MEHDAGRLSALERLIRFGTTEDLRRFFLLLRPQDLADLIEGLPEEDRLRVVRAMEAPLASEVLPEVESPERKEILEDLPAEEIADIVRESASDDAADLVGELTEQKAAETLEHLDRGERQELRELLEYPEDCAGGIMQTELVSVTATDAVTDAVAQVRDLADELGEIYEIYVVDRDRHLVGRITPTQLLLSPPDKPIESIMEREPVSVVVTLDQEKLADVVMDYDLPAVPVVDEGGTLVGQVLVDDVLDVQEEEATEDIATMAGVDPEEMYGHSVWLSVRSRAPWLIPAFAGGVLASVIIHSMEEHLVAAPFLAAFIPVVLGMAGNASTQASTITVRGLALGRIELRAAWGVINREILIGVCLGVVFGALLFAYTLIANQDQEAVRLYATASGLAIFAAMSAGALLGVVVPLALHRFGVDPAVATSPFVTTANDLVGAFLLFMLAFWVGLI